MIKTGFLTTRLMSLYLQHFKSIEFSVCFDFAFVQHIESTKSTGSNAMNVIISTKNMSIRLDKS